VVALEYGCHVRDVLKLYDYRLSLMLAEDNRCTRTGTRRDAVADRYDTRIRHVADELAGRGGHRGPVRHPQRAQWDRRAAHDGAVFTVETFARYFVHDPVHTCTTHGSARLSSACLAGPASPGPPGSRPRYTGRPDLLRASRCVQGCGILSGPAGPPARRATLSLRAGGAREPPPHEARQPAAPDGSSQDHAATRQPGRSGRRPARTSSC